MTLHTIFEYPIFVPIFVPVYWLFLVYACWRRRTKRRRWWRNDPCHMLLGDMLMTF